MRRARYHNQKGFNLVELMVVVAIIGILASVAVPRFASFKARAIQTEAKQGLNGLFLSLQAYQANYSEFPTVAQGTDAAAASVGFTLQGNKAKYTYSLHSVTIGWAGGATSNDPLAEVGGAQKWDNMRINANKWLCSVYDPVSGVAATADAVNKSASGPTVCPETGSGAKTWKVSVKCTVATGAGSDCAT